LITGYFEQTKESQEAARNLLFGFRELNCLHLHTLSLTFSPAYVGDVPTKSSRFEIQQAILDGIVLSSIRRPPFLRPTKLILENLSTMDYDRLHLGVGLSHTEVLRLTVISDNVSPRASSRSITLRFWGLFVSHNILSRCFSLTSLTLHSDLTIGSSLDFDDIILPNLRELDLGHILFDCEPYPDDGAVDLPVGIDAFIMHHADTLTRLVLRACKAKVELRLIEEPSGYEAEPRQLIWADIWTRYETRLVNLTQLEVYTERREGDEEFTFDIWYLATADGFRAFPPEHIRNADADTFALEKFRATVASRGASIMQEDL
jgi:hypothetical protein